MPARRNVLKVPWGVSRAATEEGDVAWWHEAGADSAAPAAVFVIEILNTCARVCVLGCVGERERRSSDASIEENRVAPPKTASYGCSNRVKAIFN